MNIKLVWTISLDYQDFYTIYNYTYKINNGSE